VVRNQILGDAMRKNFLIFISFFTISFVWDFMTLVVIGLGLVCKVLTRKFTLAGLTSFSSWIDYVSYAQKEATENHQVIGLNL
jgi:hypothetical protein